MKIFKSGLRSVVGSVAIMSLMSTSQVQAKHRVDQEVLNDFKHRIELFKKGWRPIWRDEFRGSEIKNRKWSHEVNCSGGGNNEQQCYTARPENSYVEDGVLHIVAREESYSGSPVFDDDPNYDPNDTSKTLPYTSARLRTKNKFDFTYGRVEVKAKVASGQGMWPAIWMLPTDNVYGGWPLSGEIDIMEAVNLGVWPNEVHGTLHYGLPWPQWENHGKTLATDYNPADDYHVYAIEWEDDEIRWYVDGKHYQTQTSDGWYNYVWKGQKKGFKVANKRAPFDEKFHLILNLAVGGDWPGAPDAAWAEDREMLVDYVRVYQCKPRHYRHHSDRGNRKPSCATVDESVAINTDAGAPGRNNYLLYSDGIETLNLDSNGTSVSNTVVPGFWELNEGTLFQSFVDVGGKRGEVWELMFNGLGNVFLSSQNMSEVEGFNTGVSLAGGSGWTNNGELEFKMKVIDASEDSRFTVKLDSGYPNLGEVSIETPKAGKWQNVKVKVSDLMANANPAGGGVDIANIQNLFVLEYSGSYAHVQIDKIKLQCAVNTEPESWQLDQQCSMEPRIAPIEPVGDSLDVYIDGFTNWAAFDCCGGVSISEVDEAGNNVVEFAYDSDPNTNTVSFFQSASPIDLSDYAGGTLEFDMFVVAQPAMPAANPWMMKVDCVFPCGTGDVPLDQSVEAVLPTTGVWQRFTFNIDDLVSRGLNLSTVDTPLVIFPSWGSQDGATFRIDNLQWFKSGGTTTPKAGLPVGFENNSVNYSFADFEGGVASVVTNPNSSAVNSSATVGRHQKFAGAVYAGSTLQLENEIDFSSTSVFKMKVLASRPVPVLFKLEGLNVELSANHSGSGDWEELNFDFSGMTGSGVSAITLIFDLGTSGDAAGTPDDWTFFFDDIRLAD